MKENEVPQDEDLLKVTREIQYALDENGNYVQIKSTGWDIKNDILKQAWEIVDDESEAARLLVLNGEKSPIYFYMKKNLLDISTLASYMGMFKFRVKRHLKPTVFAKLSEQILERYASVFEISISELKKVPDTKISLSNEKI
jgi:hypothetical protein